MAEKPIVNVAGLVAILDDFGQEALDTVEKQGIQRLMLALEARAVELTPTLTGNLEGGTSVRVEQSGDRIKGTLRFGAPYASVVHELPPDSRGPFTRSKPGNEFGQAGPKYLERPLRGFQRLMADDLGKLLQQVWGRAATRSRRG